MAVILIKIVEGIEEVRRLIGLKWHDIVNTFRDERLRHVSNITAIAAIICEAVLLVVVIFTTSFQFRMTINLGVQVTNILSLKSERS